MGIVARQSIWNTVLLYGGVLIGYCNVVLFFPKILGTEAYGLTRVLLSLVFLGQNFAMLGSPSIVIRYFPKFEAEGRRGLQWFSLMLLLAGLLLVIGVFLLFQGPIIEFKREDSPLLEDHYLLIIPILLSIALYMYLQSLCRAHLKTVLPMMVYEFLFKLITATLLGLTYLFDWTLDIFLYAWTSAYSFNFIVLLIYLWATRRLDFRPAEKYPKGFVREALDFGLFSTLAGASNSIINNVDVLMIGLLLAEDSLVGAGIYAIMVYIGNSVLMPTRGLSTIASPLISQAFERNDEAGKLSIYRKTSLNQTLITGFLISLILANLDNVLAIIDIPPDIGRPVFYFIAISRWAQAATGANGLLINFSPYYRWTTYLIIGLALLAITSNLLLIPPMGIPGAALATAISICAFEFAKWAFVWSRLKLQPFYARHLRGILALALIFALQLLLPVLSNIWLDLIYRCGIMSVFILGGLWFFDLSPDLRDTLRLILRKVGLLKS